jgi:flagellar hook-associated protein 2
MVNVGTNTNADYRISLQAIKLGDLQPGLIVGPSTPASLQAQQTHGSSTLATSQTSQTWDDNPALAYKLSIGGATYDITFTDTSAQGIASAINSQYGDKVTAAAVDVSTNGTRDYRITLTAAKPGNAEPDLLVTDGIADPASIQTQKAAGSDTKATSRTAATWTGAPGSYQLSLGGVKYALTVADNSIDSVVSAINTQYGSKVTAAKVDLGTGTTHDYRISLTAVNAGDLQPDLVESAANVQKQTATGALANYVVNNSALPVTSDTRSVTIATGITLTLLAKDNGTPVNITVTRPTSAVSDALSAFATAYNNTVDEVDKQHGTTAGPLAGQSILGQLSRILSGIGTYSSSTTGSVGGLSDLGLILDKTGHMTFNSLTLMAADISNSADVTAFLGSTTSGFLKQATDGMTGVEDSVSGLLPTMEADLKTQISGVAAAIADQQTKVDDMTLRMQTQMAAADALISSMEQQYNYIAGMFQAMDTASNQYK